MVFACGCWWTHHHNHTNQYYYRSINVTQPPYNITLVELPRAAYSPNYNSSSQSVDMGKGSSRQKKAGGKKHSTHTDTSSTSSPGNSSSQTNTDTTENEYMLQVLDLKATCGDWSNLFSRSIPEDRRMLQCKLAELMYHQACFLYYPNCTLFAPVRN